MQLVSAAYLAAEDEGAVVVVLEAAGAGLDGVLAGADAGEAGAAGVAAVAGSDVLGAASFFSPVLGAGASLPEVGFILSE
ncbi:MAG: hypothetical protein NTX84_06610 [Nitrospirae bacterium]|nr:hypothetical protein [Nitrospirota bacterium]